MRVYIVLLIISSITFLIAFVYAFFAFKIGGIINKHRTPVFVFFGLLAIGSVLGFIGRYSYPPNFALPPMMKTVNSSQVSPALPMLKVINFLKSFNDFEYIEDIGADPNAVPVLSKPGSGKVVKLELLATEVLAETAEGISFNYWTYNNQVPGPMLRVSEGDTVEISLTNSEKSLHRHNIDLHAVEGPGGGAAVTLVAPGETKKFRFKAQHPGLFVYHCASPNVSTHNAHGQYGMILVEPEGGLEKVDKEFYLMQGELYTTGGIGKKGLQVFDSQALLDGNPNYVTFNGIVEETPRMQARVGDTVRMYVGNGGVNLISSFHVIGEVFDKVYQDAAISNPPLLDVQTTAVLPGGATIVEFEVDVPGSYMLVDHALSRMNKGAWAMLDVRGENNPEVFNPIEN